MNRQVEIRFSHFCKTHCRSGIGCNGRRGANPDTSWLELIPNCKYKQEWNSLLKKVPTKALTKRLRD